MKAYLIFEKQEPTTRLGQEAWEYIKKHGKEINIPEMAGEILIDFEVNGMIGTYYKEVVPVK